jgi:alpha-1,2-mannosyltransferase
MCVGDIAKHLDPAAASAEGVHSTTARRYGVAVLRGLTVAFLAVIPVGFVLMLCLGAHRTGQLNADFKRSLWDAGRSLLSGTSPYGVANVRDPHASDKALYPPIFFMLGLPLAALPYAIAQIVWDTLLVAAVGAALWLLDVRDWRCYGLTVLSWPFAIGLLYGNVSLLLVLGFAVVWRWRDHLRVLALVVGLLVAVKLFPLPLIAWLVITRRIRAAASSTAVALALIFVPWAAIGFSGLARYRAVLDVHTRAWGAHSLSLYGAVIAAGLPATLARAAGPAVAMLCLLAAAARRNGPQGDRDSFTLAILACVAISPIVWQHYFLLLLVPIAIAAPRLSPIWFLPAAYWLVDVAPPETGQVVNTWTRVVVLIVTAAIVGLVMYSGRRATAVADGGDVESTPSHGGVVVEAAA